MKRLKAFWLAIPEQLRHLFVPLLVIVAGYFLIRAILIPSDFGLLGHYRASSIKVNMEKGMNYAGAGACTDCHDQEIQTKKNGYHRGVACETCHGPSLAHAENPEKTKPAVTRTRVLCLLCHEYLPTRPTGFPQVISDSHNPTKPCIACHRPHDPKPPQPLKRCAACHQKVQRVLSVSIHANLDCTTCHETPNEHFIKPGEFPPKRMQSRQTCLNCHDKALRSTEAPGIDAATHGEKYLCWQCHYPHMPEAR